MSNTAETKQPNPWYREPYAWVVAAPLILVLIACCFTVTIAVKSADDRVSDDYYKDGRMLSQEFTSDDYARSIGVHADLTLSQTDNSITAVVGADQPSTLEQVIELKFLISHPAEQAKDIELTLTPSGPDTFSAALPRSLSGRWYLRLQGLGIEARELWRLHGEINLDNRNTITLAPK